MTLEETIAYYQKVVDAVPENPVPNVGRWCPHNHIKEVLWWFQDYRALKTENDELKRLLRLAVDDFEKLANVESCYYPFCGERCPFDCTGGCEEREWKHRDEAMKLLGGTESVD